MIENNVHGRRLIAIALLLIRRICIAFTKVTTILCCIAMFAISYLQSCYFTSHCHYFLPHLFEFWQKRKFNMTAIEKYVHRG